MVVLLAASVTAHADSTNVFQLTQADVVTRPGGSFDLPASHAPDMDAATAQWQRKSLPYLLARGVVTDKQEKIVTTWFRLSIPRFQATREQPYLYVPRWQTIGKIAVYSRTENGHTDLIERSRGGAVWNGYNHPLWIPLGRPGEQPPTEVLIRLDHWPSAGAALSTVWVGDESALSSSHFFREAFQTKVPEISSAAFLLLGLFSFGVWIRRRRETDYLLFFASSTLSYIRCMQYYVGLEPLVIPEDWFGWLTVNSTGWLVITIYCFAFRLHGRRYPVMEKCLVALMLLALVLTLPISHVLPDISLLTPLAYLILFGVVIVASVVMCFASWRSHSKEGLVFSLWNLINIPAIVHDLLLQNYRLNIESVYVMPYLVLGTFSIFLMIVLRRYLNALSEMELANVRLESRLQQREAELGQSYEQLRQAERLQVLNDERQRLIRDMHDGFGSSLISALMAVDHGSLSAPQVAQVLRECIDDLRLTIDSMEPEDTDLLLLLASLRFRLQPRLEQAGLALHWHVDEQLTLDWLTPGSALQVLRILQEIFTNVIKHASATEIRMHVKNGSENVLIAIEDNGKGFVPEATDDRKGRGLSNLRRRASSLNATVQWLSQPGSTRFELKLPVNPTLASMEST